MSALRVAVDMGFIIETAAGFAPASPISQVTRTSNVGYKAAVLRLMLDAYEPFVVFRERLLATGQATLAAEQTRVALDLEADRDDIRETLVLLLAGFAQAFQSLGGGRYAPSEQPTDLHIAALAQGLADDAAALLRIRERLGPEISAAVSHDVLVPLGRGLRKALENNTRGAIVEAGNAVESYLAAWAARLGRLGEPRHQCEGCSPRGRGGNSSQTGRGKQVSRSSPKRSRPRRRS